MKLRLALSALVYAVALSVALLVVTGHLSLTPFAGETQQVMALDNGDSGSSTLLCYGCYGQNQYQAVLVTVTFQPNYCSWGCNNNQWNNWNSCYSGCGTAYWNNWNNCYSGCGTTYWNDWNSGCSWGCGNTWQNYYPLYGACNWGCNSYNYTNTNWNTGCGCSRYW